jgi:hypothetical protein
MKHKKTVSLKSVAQIIEYWQNKNHTHEVDYKAITEFVKENDLLPVRAITKE